jgi:hypothetical protein
MKRNEWIEISGWAIFLRNEGAWVVRLMSWPSNRASSKWMDAWFKALPKKYYFRNELDMSLAEI